MQPIPTPLTTVRLSQDEKNFLLMLYRKRRRVLAVSYLILMLIAFKCSYRIDYKGKRWEENEEAKYVSRLGMRMINVCWLEIPLIATWIYFYRKSAAPLKVDALAGVKEQVPYTVQRKEYFPITNQYFFALDDPDYLHHEVDAQTYSLLNEGDTIYIYRGVRSKFVFEESGKYAVL